MVGAYLAVLLRLAREEGREGVGRRGAGDARGGLRRAVRRARGAGAGGLPASDDADEK